MAGPSCYDGFSLFGSSPRFQVFSGAVAVNFPGVLSPSTLLQNAGGCISRVVSFRGAVTVTAEEPGPGVSWILTVTLRYVLT